MTAVSVPPGILSLLVGLGVRHLGRLPLSVMVDSSFGSGSSDGMAGSVCFYESAAVV